MPFFSKKGSGSRNFRGEKSAIKSFHTRQSHGHCLNSWSLSGCCCLVANTASPRKGGNLAGRQTMCFPFKAGCELGLLTITLSTFVFQGSPSASSGAGRINTVTGQWQFLAHGSRRLQLLRKDPAWGLTWHLTVAYIFPCAPLLGTNVFLFPSSSFNQAVSTSM